MPIDATIFTHDQDRMTLQALKSIPGFTPLLKAFMKVWDEKMFRIENMSTNLRISERQLPKYYHMLPPICEKLGIEVPELYLTMDGSPNAYTAGDTKPFIVMTSGLLKSLPEELIPTVLAHECGHIACHHVLYHTMGQLILNGAATALELNGLITLPLQSAFQHWMRASEFSADRAAAVCDGGSEKIVQMCMHFAGMDRSIPGLADPQVFMEQALEYREMMKNSVVDKVLEMLMYSNNSHPLNAVRAYECDQWCRGMVFGKIQNYLGDQDAIKNGRLLGDMPRNDLPLAESARELYGRNYLEVQAMLQRIGFTNIELRRSMVKTPMVRIGQVLSVSIDGNDSFGHNGWYPVDAQIILHYYEPMTQEEIMAANPDKVFPPDAAKRFVGRQYRLVQQEFLDAGFVNVIMEPQYGSKFTWLMKEGGVTRVTVGGRTAFERSEGFQPDIPVRISYYTAFDMAKGGLPGKK